ncbi:MAG TPA: hypothetical protein PKU97_08105 [Kofleriaceae bacterium]|nr:hypothetical protein [Kofleriaceae bacterium]
MDLVGASSRLDVQLGTTRFDQGDSEFKIVPVRLNLFGELMDPRGFGGYANLSFTYTSFELAAGATGKESFSALAMGAAEAGGVLARRFSWGTLLGRVGLALPTASGSEDRILANDLGRDARLTDLALIEPDTTWLRASASWSRADPDTILRVELGLDAAVGGSDDFAPGSVVRLNVGAAMRWGVAQLGFELMNVIFVDAAQRDSSQHALGAVVRADLGTWAPALALSRTLGSGVGESLSLVASATWLLPAL